MTDTKVAGYVAKYATKAADCTGTLDRRITPADRIADPVMRNMYKVARKKALA